LNVVYRARRRRYAAADVTVSVRHDVAIEAPAVVVSGTVTVGAADVVVGSGLTAADVVVASDVVVVVPAEAITIIMHRAATPRSRRDMFDSNVFPTVEF